MQEIWDRSLGWEDPLEKEMATHFSIFAWEIPRTEETGGLQSAAKSSQSCLTLCDPIDGSPPGSPVPGIFQARTLQECWSGLPFPSPMHESEK